MSDNNQPRRPLDKALCNRVEDEGMHLPLGDRETRFLRGRITCLRNQRDQFVYEIQRLDSADDLAVESFRQMAEDCNRRLKNIRQVLIA